MTARAAPCVMMMPPTMRVLTPQELWYTYCCSWFSSRNCVPNALAKFCPRLWLVPACHAQLHPTPPTIFRDGRVWDAAREDCAP